MVESLRVDGKVKQVVAHNLGRHFPIDKAYWRGLAQRIKELLAAGVPLIPVDVPQLVEREAQRIAALLRARDGRVAEVGVPAVDGAGVASADIEAVDVHSLELLRPRSVGVEQVGLWAMQQVDFVGLLAEWGFSGPQRAAVLALIIARMAEPGSELASWKWLLNESGLGEWLDFDFEQRLPLKALYRASDRLVRRRGSVEAALFNRISDLFSLDTSIVLYDLTNTSELKAIYDTLVLPPTPGHLEKTIA